MKIIASIGLLIAALLFLASCASLTKEECLVSDWQVIGQRDGEQGQDPQRQFRRHITACEKVKVTPDHVLWNQGYQQGLVRYCTPVKGLVVGQQGAVYNNVCPAHSERGFLRGYLLGKTENNVKSSINSLESQTGSLKTEIDTLLEKVTKADPTQAQVLRVDINQKREERDFIQIQKQREIYRLARIERLVEQFLQNPEMSYDPNLL